MLNLIRRDRDPVVTEFVVHGATTVVSFKLAFVEFSAIYLHEHPHGGSDGFGTTLPSEGDHEVGPELNPTLTKDRDLAPRNDFPSSQELDRSRLGVTLGGNDVSSSSQDLVQHLVPRAAPTCGTHPHAIAQRVLDGQLNPIDRRKPVSRSQQVKRDRVQVSYDGLDRTKPDVGNLDRCVPQSRSHYSVSGLAPDGSAPELWPVEVPEAVQTVNGCSVGTGHCNTTMSHYRSEHRKRSWRGRFLASVAGYLSVKTLIGPSFLGHSRVTTIHSRITTEVNRTQTPFGAYARMKRG